MKNTKKGLTLIEIIISLAILGIIITPIFSMIITSTKMGVKSNDKIMANLLAQQCSEYIKFTKNLNFEEIELSEINSNEVINLFKDDVEEFKLYGFAHRDEYKNVIALIKVSSTQQSLDALDEKEYPIFRSFEIEIWKYDTKKKEKILLQSLKSSSVLN